MNDRESLHPRIPESTRSRNSKSKGEMRVFEHRRSDRKAPNAALGAYPEIKPNLIDSYDVRAILVHKCPSGALLMLY